MRSEGRLGRLVALVLGLAATVFTCVAAVCIHGGGSACHAIVDTARAFGRAFIDPIAARVRGALGLFGPTGVFAIALASVSVATSTRVRAWRKSVEQSHYRAPGSWVSCASI